MATLGPRHSLAALVVLGTRRPFRAAAVAAQSRRGWAPVGYHREVNSHVDGS